jgi:cell division protein FtsZ
MIHTNEHLVKIKVMGIGGSGGNAINDMIEAGVGGVEYIAANTDAQDLHNSLADIRIQLGEKSTRGLGAGANPEIGKQAAEEDIDKIKTLLEETDMLFITSGMGGGTGTGAAPVIARVAKDMGILTVAVVTKPFSFEGKNRMKNADSGIVNLKDAVDALIIIPNDKLFELPEKTITLQNAFMEANNVLKIGIKGLADLILKTGLINLDFADIRTTMLDSGIAMIGFGESEGENRAVKATEKALQSPLLEKSIAGAGKILLNITASSALGLNEAFAISNMVKEAAGKPEDVMFGVTADDEMGELLQVTIVATNFGDEATSEEKVVAIEKPSLEKKVEEKEEEDLEIPAWMRRGK